MPKSTNAQHVAPWSRPYQPSNMEISKFERYLQVIEAPLSTLADLEAGQLTQEHVEALQAVYPQLYDSIKSKVLDEVAEHPEKLTYSKKVQLSLLMNADTDLSLEPDAIAALQANFTPPPEQSGQGASGAVNSTVGGMGELNTAQRAMTDTQKLSAKA